MQWADLARRRDFRRLWLGDAVSLLGDWFTYVAVGLLALEAGEGLTAVAMVLVAHTLPKAVFAPYAGRLADRLDRRRIMVVVSLMRAAIVAAMAVAAYADQLLVVQGLLFVRMALGAFIDPAAQASLPQLLPGPLLGRANALLGATWSVVFTVGVGLGGLVTAVVGPVGALSIDVVTFVAAAAILSRLPRLRPGDTPGAVMPGGAGSESAECEADGPGPTADIGVDRADAADGADGDGGAEQSATRGVEAGQATLEGEPPPALGLPLRPASGPSSGLASGLAPVVDQGRLRDAWRIVLRRPLVLEAAFAKVPIMLVGGGGWVLLHGVAEGFGTEGFGTAALALGALHSVRGVGTGIGPLFWARSPRLSSARLGLNVGTWLTLAAVLLFALVDAPIWVFAAVGIWGFGTGATWITSATRVQLLTPSPILGRVAAIDQLGLLLSQCFTGLCGALIADASGFAPHAAWFGLGAGILAWAGLWLFVRRGLRVHGADEERAAEQGLG